MDIYSSKTTTWIFKESKWGEKAQLTFSKIGTVFLMVVKVALWYELRTSLMDLCWIIFLLSDLITEQALILLYAH